MKREHALKLRAAIVKASASLDDSTALTAVELFAPWASGMDYTLGERIRYGEKLYRCEQAHTSQTDWTPDVTPAMWTEVAEPGTIPVWRQPTGVQDAYAKGDKVHYPTADDPVYESLIDANIYSPEAYPAGWQVVTP